MSELKTAWFSFGFQHVHRVGGFTFDKDVIVEITSECPRTTMFESFGHEWSFQYNLEPDMRYFPRGVRKL